LQYTICFMEILRSGGEIQPAGNDAALLAAIRAKGANVAYAFTILDQQYRKRLLGLINRKIAGRMPFTADDVVQEVWLSH